MKKIFALIISFLIVQSFQASFALEIEDMDYWKNSKKITVYVPQNKRRILVKKCFKNWINASGGNIQFTYLDFAKNANIEIEFTSKIPDAKQNNGEILGITRSKYTPDNRIIKAKIQIPYKAQNNIVLDDITLEHVLTHEIGHALGLGHSQDRKSVMYYATESFQTIQNEDIIKLKNIYKW